MQSLLTTISLGYPFSAVMIRAAGDDIRLKQLPLGDAPTRPTEMHTGSSWTDAIGSHEVISRLATNSSRMKRWAVVLVSTILVLSARDGL